MEKILDDVCDTIHNYFVHAIRRGTFTIENGSLDCDFLQEGQYFRVVGSVFNDGVWKNGDGEMTNETFTGQVWAMAVPPSVIALLSDIAAWEAKYNSLDSGNMSPYTSESFNNYSYSKATVARSGGTSGAPMTWKDVFGAQLDRWRKVA